MGLVTSKEIAKVIGVDKFGAAGTFIGWTLMKILRISAVNRLYDNNKDKSEPCKFFKKLELFNASRALRLGLKLIDFKAFINAIFMYVAS